MKLSLAALSFILPSIALAAVNGPCGFGGSYVGLRNRCICTTRSVCANFGGTVLVEGEKGDWVCPSDPDNIIGCIKPGCAGGPGHLSRCQFKDREACPGRWLPNPVCPGRDNFACCNEG